MTPNAIAAFVEVERPWWVLIWPTSVDVDVLAFGEVESTVEVDDTPVRETGTTGGLSPKSGKSESFQRISIAIAAPRLTWLTPWAVGVA